MKSALYEFVAKFAAFLIGVNAGIGNAITGFMAGIFNYVSVTLGISAASLLKKLDNKRYQHSALMLDQYHELIVNLFAAIPLVGPDLSLWIRGDYVVSDATLNRFFSFHVIAVPLVLIGLVAAHIVALHEVGSNNPDGIDIKENVDANGVPLDGIPFHPYYSVHDIMGVGVFLMIFAFIVFFAPEMNGYFLEFNNFIPADPLKTPPHIAPVWYFTPFYSMLRATTTEFLIPMWVFAAILLGKVIRETDCKKTKAVCAGVLAALAAGFFLFDAKFWAVVS